jgi:hypothetical protein
MVWGNLGYMFGCDYISYGLILLRFWVCVLIIMARESAFRSVYYPNLFLIFVVLLIIMLFCTFSRTITIAVMTNGIKKCSAKKRDSVALSIAKPHHTHCTSFLIDNMVLIILVCIVVL